MIFFHEASISFQGSDARSFRQRTYPDKLFHDQDADLGASGNFPKSFAQRSSAGEPGPDSARDVGKRGLAGVGFAGTESDGQHARAGDGNMDLHNLHHGSLWLWISVRPVRIWVWLRFWERRCVPDAPSPQLRLLR